MHRSRSALVLGSVFAVVAVLFAFQSSNAAEPAHLNPPSRIAVLGDSISRGYSANNVLGEHPELNWATGTSTSVNSLFRRLQVLNPAIAANNDAVSGAKMTNLAGQAANAVAQGADYVVIEMGGNDACTSSVSNMTSVATYRAQFQTAMNVLSQGLPNARIYVASVPNVWYLWNSNYNNFIARLVWSLGGICQSLLASPTCVTQACIDRRAAVAQRTYDFSVQLDEVCDQYIHCDFDDYAINSTPFAAADISTADYFHPSIKGQNLLADGAWLTGPDFSDTTAPQTTISPDRAPDGVDGWYKGNVTITLTATDPDSAVSGTEYYYQLEGASGSTPWIRYTAPFTITSEGTTIVSVRSVDVNGNTEAVQEESIKIDKTAPTLSLSCPASVILGGTGTIIVEAGDDRSGFVTDPSGSFDFVAAEPGPQLHELTIWDRAGNTASASCTINVLYAFGGVRQPINADGSSIFKRGSTVPVKFQLQDANGDFVGTAVATVSVAKISDGVEGTYVEAVSTCAATTGNLFRYDATDQQYIFNLGTKTLDTGTYRLKIALDDGAVYYVQISLR